MNTYVMELGSTNITSEYVDDFQETRYLLAVHNERNSSATASLEFIYSIEDTGRGLLESDEFESEYDLVSVVSTDLFVNKEYRMTYDRSFHVSEMDITISHIESDYIEQNNLDRTRSNLLLVFSRELTGGSDFTLEAGRSHIDYTTLLPERKDDIYRYSALYSYNARRNINLDYQVIYQEQKSTIYDLNYNDTRFMISLIYFSN